MPIFRPSEMLGCAPMYSRTWRATRVTAPEQHVRYLTILFENDAMMSIRSSTDLRVLTPRVVGARYSYDEGQSHLGLFRRFGHLRRDSLVTGSWARRRCPDDRRRPTRRPPGDQGESATTRSEGLHRRCPPGVRRPVHPARPPGERDVRGTVSPQYGARAAADWETSRHDRAARRRLIDRPRMHGERERSGSLRPVHDRSSPGSHRPRAREG